ncbi:EscU/YscU/HrcU family type III secretion system export apparatus switch protein [Lederbergia ruris]|uniref:EscU/YscU/HrcU family type III secretion system export apparatus switch protein n=1 Tax=Lederbergia ruris TaxID=217495 RepID=A0ABQ4KHU5_9BACI|nr:EscU/YscU/HrcU family type III secretion system export apparatus switch protein [Lederbergia ruris]GIN57529.1 hypothetical protein J8TS2_18480 [Lederbergia ruris]
MKKQHKQSRKEAIALGYQSDKHEAPVVLAKGRGLIAENIMETAKNNQIPIQQDPALLELLGQLNINEAIPEELYQAVAEVFAFVYRLDQKKADDS